MGIDVGFSAMRFALVLLALFWVQDLIGKEIDRRTTIIYLSYPVPRSHYLMGRFLGISTLLLIAALVLSLLLLIAVIGVSETYAQARRGDLAFAFWLTAAGIWINALVVTAFSIAIASISTIPALPLTLGAAFSIAGLTLGTVVDYLTNQSSGAETALVQQFGPIVSTISWVLPDLSRLDWRNYVMYNSPIQTDVIGLGIGMAFFYIALMLSIATWSFNHREFD